MTNYIMLLGEHENVLQKLPSPLSACNNGVITEELHVN